MMENMFTWFAEADEDEDGVLNQEEWLVFRQKFTDAQTAAVGGSAILSHDEDRAAWVAVNTIDTSYEGMKIIDLQRSFMVFGALAAAAGHENSGHLNLHDYQLYVYNGQQRHNDRLQRLIDQYEHEHGHDHLNLSSVSLKFRPRWVRTSYNDVPNLNLQAIEQEFGDPEAWKEWIVSHFDEEEKEDVQATIDAYLSRQVTPA